MNIFNHYGLTLLQFVAGITICALGIDKGTKPSGGFIALVFWFCVAFGGALLAALVFGRNPLI